MIPPILEAICKWNFVSHLAIGGDAKPQQAAMADNPRRPLLYQMTSKTISYSFLIIQKRLLHLPTVAQKKLKRFSEIKTFHNVLEYPENIKGKWNEFFKNDHAIVLELACGKGEYTTGLAQLYPDKNFIGVDIKGNRLWVGAKFSIENQLTNTAFLRTQIDKIDQYFSENEISEIWITFPDPQLRLSKAKKRLTHPRFLRLYHKILKPNGKIHLKTDSPHLYHFTKSVIRLYQLPLIADIDNVNEQPNLNEELKIKTHYEGLDIAGSNCTFYLCFMLPEIIIDNDKGLNDMLTNNPGPHAQNRE